MPDAASTSTIDSPVSCTDESSGVDQPTEFLLRSLAIATGGTYTFLTNDSGIGGDHTEPTIGTFEVELLNDLLVRVIGRALKP